METTQSPPNGQRSTEEAARTLGQKVDRVSDTAQEAWSRTREAITDIKGTLDLDGRVKRHPYGSVAAALGVGFVLGGGIFTPLTARILGLGLRIGMRLAVLPLLKEELLGMADAFEGSEGEGSGARSRRTRQGTTNKGR